MDKIKEAYIEIIGLPVPTGSIEDQMNLGALIKEDKHKELNVGQSALGYLKKNLKQEIIKVDNEILKSLILLTWRHYNDFCINCMDVDLYLLETDFRKPILAAKQIQEIKPNINVKNTEESLKDSMHGTYGLSFKIEENSYVVLIDSSIYKNDEKIQHEFGHYVQEVTGKLILNNDIKEDLKKYFNIQNQYVIYILNNREFWINIYSDLFNGLQKIYWLRFKNEFKWEEFIQDQFDSLKLNASNYSNTQLYRFWNVNVKTNVFYINVLAVISYVKPKFYEEIVEKLKNK